MKNYQEILEKCIKTADERQKQYGESSISLDSASNIMLQTYGIKISPQDICKVLIALKLSRNKEGGEKPDSFIDIINYNAIIAYLNEKDT